MKILKIFFSIILMFFLSLNSSFSNLLKKEDIRPTENSGIETPINKSDSIELSDIFPWFKGELVTIVFLISISVFVFIGIRMSIAEGNPEQFKKAWLHFIYAIIGLFFIFAALGIVMIIANLGQNFIK